MIRPAFDITSCSLTHVRRLNLHCLFGIFLNLLFGVLKWIRELNVSGHNTGHYESSPTHTGLHTEGEQTPHPLILQAAAEWVSGALGTQCYTALWFLKSILWLSLIAPSKPMSLLPPPQKTRLHVSFLYNSWQNMYRGGVSTIHLLLKPCGLHLLTTSSEFTSCTSEYHFECNLFCEAEEASVRAVLSSLETNRMCCVSWPDGTGVLCLTSKHQM